MQTVLDQIVGIFTGNVIPTLIVLTAVVFVHEMGHFLVARWCGIRVAAFSIGFGRELAGFNDRNGTRWKLSAIPLGGYVRFEGDDNAASMPDAEALERVPPAERKGLFYFAPLWKRVAVVAAGPIANFILAVLIFAALFSLIGRAHVPPVVGEVEAGSAAYEAGFEAGDRVVSADGRTVDSFAELQDIVVGAVDHALTVVVTRDGNEITLTATPRTREVTDLTGRVHRMPVLGIKSGPPDFRTDDPLTALGAGVTETWRIIDRTLGYVGQLLTGRQSPQQLSGLIGIGQVSGVVADNGGVSGLIYLTAILSVSIGLFNLFPVPMLDGGHLLFYLIEALRGRPLSPRVQDLGFRIGFALVIVLFIFVTFNDIANLPGIFPGS
jgi:regulator of sigma E protease